MTTARLTDGTTEVFETNESTDDWKAVVDDMKKNSLTGSARPFADVEFKGKRGQGQG